MARDNKHTNQFIELVLCIFLGCFGIHRFYAGRKISGFVYLFTFGLFGIGWFFDSITIIVKSIKSILADRHFCFEKETHPYDSFQPQPDETEQAQLSCQINNPTNAELEEIPHTAISTYASVKIDSKEETMDHIEQKEAPVTPFPVQIKASSYTLESLLAKGSTISLLDLNGYSSQSGGYLNWAIFQVRGKNSQTGRMNTRRYEAKDESAVAALAQIDGLTEPFEIKVLSHEAPTERQIGYLQTWDVPLPEGATKQDVSAILTRLEHSDDIVSENRISKDYVVRRVIPAPSPSEEFAIFADEMGVKFSRYIGERTLLGETVWTLPDRNKAAFFAYCVLCSVEQTKIGDFRKSKHADRLNKFADYAMQNDSLIKSITSRDSSDYTKPHRGTIAYKAVKEFFDLR